MTDLRSGYSTGTCAAAAAKAAAFALRGTVVERVRMRLPRGEDVTLPVASVERVSATCAQAAVVKDAGDDPDVTHGMTVVVTLELTGDDITFVAGEGVGTVTKAGLQIPPGEPAINPVPRQLIAQAVREVFGDVGVRVTVSIPGGAATARKTFNPRLGIAGGLSILGTSGRVEPKSEDAWLRSLVPQIDVALAAGHTTLYLVPGSFGETAVREVLGAPEIAIAQTSNFIGAMLLACAERGAHSVVLVGHVGKLVKIAAGIFDTHSRHGDARLETVAAVAAAEGAPGPLVAQLLELPTCEAAIPILAHAGLAHVWDAIAARAARRATAHAGIPVACMVIGYGGEVLGHANLEDRVPDEPPQNSLTIVGVGPGPAEWLTPAAWQAIRRAEVLVGGKRHLEEFARDGVERIPIGADIAAVIAAIRARQDKRVVVLATGDPACFGMLATLRREMSDAVWDTIPGIGAMQLALSKLRLTWDEVHFASAHGRSLADVVQAAQAYPKVLAFTDAKSPAQALAAALVAQGLHYQMSVLERLGYPDERVTSGTVGEIAAGLFDPLAVVYMAW